MNDKVIVFLIMFVIVFSVVGISSKKLKAEEESTIFEDNFEEYSTNSFPSLGGWVLRYNGKGDAYQKVVDTTSVSGSKSLQLWGVPSWAACAMKEFTYSSNMLGYEVYIRTESLSTDKRIAYVAFYNKDMETWGTSIARVFFYGDGTVRVKGNSIIQTYEAGRWYKVRVILDISAKEYSVWINDVLKAENISEENADKVKSFILDSEHAGIKAYFDDVRVFTSFQIPVPTTTPIASKTQELYYDDGSTEYCFANAPGGIGAVRFSVSSTYQILKLKYYITGKSKDMNIYVLNENYNILFSKRVTPYAGWFVVNISNYEVFVNGDFYVVAEWIYQPTEGPYIGIDNTPPHHDRSYYGGVSRPSPAPRTEDYMVRCVVEPASLPAPATTPVSTTTPSPTTPPPVTTPKPQTPAPTASAPSTTLPPTTISVSPSQSNSLLYIGLSAAVIICIFMTYQVTKKKTEKKLMEKKLEEKIEKKYEETPQKNSEEEISSELEKLLEEKTEWRKKLEDLRKKKEDLIKRGLMSEKTYQDRYEEIMDKLVNIEDKIIQEKMKGGKKK